MPKTKLGNETKDHVAKKARVENIKCDMSARLAEEGLKFYKEAVCHKTESSEQGSLKVVISVYPYLQKTPNFSRFYKKLGPFYKKLRCDKFGN